MSIASGVVAGLVFSYSQSALDYICDAAGIPVARDDVEEDEEDDEEEDDPDEEGEDEASANQDSTNDKAATADPPKDNGNSGHSPDPGQERNPSRTKST